MHTKEDYVSIYDTPNYSIYLFKNKVRIYITHDYYGDIDIINLRILPLSVHLIINDTKYSTKTTTTPNSAHRKLYISNCVVSQQEIDYLNDIKSAGTYKIDGIFYIDSVEI